jgi:integrase/recombinase XerC
MKKRFINYITYQKRFSPHTITSYANDLDQFDIYFSDLYACSVEEANEIMIRSWVMYAFDKGLAAKTINRKISTLKSFFRYLQTYEGYEKNPAAHVPVPRISQEIPVFLTEEQMKGILSEEFFENTFEGIRDHLIFELFYQSGIRLSELVNLKTENIDFNNKTIKVLGKRRKERIVPVSDNLVQYLKIYLEERNKIATETNFVFVTVKGKQAYDKLVYRIVNKHLLRVATLKKASPHVLRHTFATHMLNRGADINAVKALLGHASLSATQIYTHNTMDKIKSIYKQAHPRA